MDVNGQAPIFDLAEAIRQRQEREALRAAIAFSRDGASQFRPQIGVMVGTHEAQLRLLDALEAGCEVYTHPISTLSALFSQLAGIMGYTAASLPPSYGASLKVLWNEAGPRAFETYKACIGAVEHEREQAAKQAKPPEDNPTAPLSSV